jgi:signal transduction histidine kinase/ligand-binding sensor domain-containing protein
MNSHNFHSFIQLNFEMNINLSRNRIKSFVIQAVLLCLYLFCGINFVSAQSLNFDHYLVADGISQSEILNIHQDTEGYIWIGTQNGLNRFDGYTFEKFFYEPSDNHSISNNWIYDIAEDPDGGIWLGTKRGLNIYDKRTGWFSVVPHKNANSIIPDNFVYGLIADSTSVYINTPPVLAVLNRKTGSLQAFKDDFDYDGILYDVGNPIIKDSKGLIWLGSHHGLSCFDLREKQFTDFLHNVHVTALYEDNLGNIMIGTADGMLIYNRKSKKLTPCFTENNDPDNLRHTMIHSIMQDNTGATWIATEGDGIGKMVFNKDGSFGIEQFRSGAGIRNVISHDIVYALYEDNSNNLWIGTIAGVDKTDLKKKNIRYYRKSNNPGSIDLLDNIIASVYKDKYGNLWIGNWGKGLNILNRTTGEVIHYSSDFPGKMHLPENHVHVIFEDSESLIWLGTRNGVCIYNENTGRFIPVQDYFNTPEFNLFENIRVYCMIEDSDGRIWIGTGNGINILDKRTKQASSLRAGNEEPFNISSNLVYSLLQDKDRDVWIATSNGLDRYIPGENIMYHYVNDPASTNTLIDNFTISLCEDYLGNIWIGTSSGVNIFNKTDSVFSYYSNNDGLPSNIIYDIIEDDSNNLWLSTGSGIVMVDPGKKISNNFRIIDELRDREFNLNAIYKSDDGELFFGGVDGMVSFYPDSITVNSYIPPIRITSIIKESEGKRQKINVYTDGFKLTNKEYSFTIEFSALDYTNPAKNRYAYQMEGISDQWIDIGTLRSLRFTNLPPREYTFNVKGTNNDGVWNDTPTSMIIRILPPWWRSAYAIFAYVVLVLVLIIMIVKRRERNLINAKRKLEASVVARTAEIELQKEKLEELNATKDKFFSILAHDLKNPFTNLYSMSELIAGSYDILEEEEKIKILQSINKSADLIYNLLGNLLTWSKSQRGLIEYNPAIFNLREVVRVNINLHKVPAEAKGVILKTDLKEDIQAYGDREMINTVLRNLINNAVKFTDQGSTVEVIVSKQVASGQVASKQDLSRQDESKQVISKKDLSKQDENKQVASIQDPGKQDLSRQNKYIEVQVKDQGVGISAENLQKLFHIDVKFKSKGTKGETGTGLGLILCKEFVEKNGGKIWAESKEGEGSSFYFTIPVR